MLLMLRMADQIDASKTSTYQMAALSHEMRTLLFCADRNKCGSGRAISVHSRGHWRGRPGIWRGGRKLQVQRENPHSDLVGFKQIRDLGHLVTLKCYILDQCLLTLTNLLAEGRVSDCPCQGFVPLHAAPCS